MSRRPLSKTNIRKLTKFGDSLFVSIPKEMLNMLAWREKQRVKVKKIRGGVAIHDWKK